MRRGVLTLSVLVAGVVLALVLLMLVVKLPSVLTYHTQTAFVERRTEHLPAARNGRDVRRDDGLLRAPHPQPLARHGGGVQQRRVALR